GCYLTYQLYDEPRRDIRCPGRPYSARHFRQTGAWRSHGRRIGEAVRYIRTGDLASSARAGEGTADLQPARWATSALPDHSRCDRIRGGIDRSLSQFLERKLRQTRAALETDERNIS